FSIRELVTRVHAVLRRPRTGATATPVTRPLILGDLVIDQVSHDVRVRDTAVALTRTEFDLLMALAIRPGQVLSRHDLVTEVWTPPGSAMNASSMSTSATCAANSVPTLMTTGLSTPSAGLATGWGRHEPRTRSDLPILRRPGPGRRDQPGRGGRRGLAGGAITIS